jgi:hypothetical protein
VFVGIGLALPVAIGIAILKHRLYAIDKIISRTVSYALVTGPVVGAYLGFNRARYDADQTGPRSRPGCGTPSTWPPSSTTSDRA